jgi:hypothetical protein
MRRKHVTCCIIFLGNRQTQAIKYGRQQPTQAYFASDNTTANHIHGVAGILVALPCAFILKRFQEAPGESQNRGHRDLAFSGTVYEIALVVMSAYMAYLTAEAIPFQDTKCGLHG